MSKLDFINKKTMCIGAIVFTAFVLKLFYPSSSTDDLQLFIQPTAEIVSILHNEPFMHNASGFYFPQLNVLIEKSCSGFNFFIIALCVFASIVPYQYLSSRLTVFVMPFLVLFVYGITICVNTSRIVVAIFMLRLEPEMPWITQPWVHEAEGALVYLFALLGAYLITTHYLNKLDLRYAKRSQPMVVTAH
jgi:exosortase K